MDDFIQVKIEIFIPTEYVDSLLDELAKVQVGVIGNYDHCCSLTPVRGTWRPLPGAKPYEGKVGVLQSAAETKVEVNSRREYVQAALEVIRRVHPYEEPVINIIPLANHLFG